MGQVAEKKEKAYPSHFLKFLFACLTNGTFSFVQQKKRLFAKLKEPFFPTHLFIIWYFFYFCQKLTS